jgi:nitrate reductase alpha subunit
VEIRSYKAIYEKFQSMFPELAKMSGGFKGVCFRDKLISIRMLDGSVITFSFMAEDNWTLARIPEGELV